MRAWKLLFVLLAGVSVWMLSGCGGGSGSDRLTLAEWITRMNADIASEDDVPLAEWQAVRDGIAEYANDSPDDAYTQYAHAVSETLWLGAVAIESLGDMVPVRSRGAQSGGEGIFSRLTAKNLVRSARNPREFAAETMSDYVQYPLVAMSSSSSRSRLLEEEITYEEIAEDIENMVLPSLDRIINALEVAASNPDVGLRIINPIEEDARQAVEYIKFDQGDAQIFLSLAHFIKSVCHTFLVYNLDPGDWDSDDLFISVPAGSTGVIEYTEYLPPSPFLILRDRGQLNLKYARADIVTGLDKLCQGINTTLTEPDDDEELIPWHTDTDLQELMENVLPYIGMLQEAFASDRYTIDLSRNGDEEPLVINLSAWAHSPIDTPPGQSAPADLKYFMPPLLYDDKDDNGVIDLEEEGMYFLFYLLFGDEEEEYEGEITDFGDFPDPTFGGLFPDGYPVDGND